MAITYKLGSTNDSVSILFENYTPKDYSREVTCWIARSSSGPWLNVKRYTIKPGNTTAFFTYNNLEPGTDYYLKARMTGKTMSYDYGPYRKKTTGTSYNDMTGNCSIMSYGAYVSITLSGVNTQAGYDRTVKIYRKKVGGSYILSDTKTISGSSTKSTFYYYIFGLEEKTDYTVKVEVINPNGGIIKSWEQGVTTGFDTGGSLLVSNVNEKSCTITVSNVPTSARYPRTLTWYGKEGQSGEWEHLTTTYAMGNNTYTLNSLIPSTYYEFKVDVTVDGNLIDTLSASCTTSEASGTLEASEVTEYSSRVLLSNLATGVSYVRTIKWFYRTSTETTYTKYDKENTLSQSASSAAMVIDTLASGTAYSIKAEIYNSDGKLLGSRACVVTTKPTTAQISYGSVTASSIKITVSGLGKANYARKFEWYYKRSDDSNYIKFDESVMEATDESGKISKIIKPLIAKTKYDFIVKIKKGSTIMKELQISTFTAIDNSIVADTEILEVRTEVGNRTVKVFWVASGHQTGCNYRVQFSMDDETFVDSGEIISNPTDSYTEITVNTLNDLYYIRVHSYYEINGEIASKYSDSVPVFMYAKFLWDTEKVAENRFSLTSSEWNRFVNAIKARLKNSGLTATYEMTDAIKGKPVTAEQYNQVCRAINAFNPFEFEEQEEGNVITADMLNTIVNKLNLEGAE